MRPCACRCGQQIPDDARSTRRYIDGSHRARHSEHKRRRRELASASRAGGNVRALETFRAGYRALTRPDPRERRIGAPVRLQDPPGGH